MKINDKGFWENNSTIGHYNDVVLLDELRRIIQENNIKTLIDLGCGNGFYAKNLKENVEQTECYDGNPFTPQITNELCETMDFSVPFNLNKTFDCVMSLEVGEHIPIEFEQIFLDNLVKHSNSFILLSWAIPNQPGDGHINCRSNEYIIQEMNKRGFLFNLNESQKIREKNVIWWFKNTFMFFYKKS
jgi:hypothetical protein